jgi:hypothetical protein
MTSNSICWDCRQKPEQTRTIAQSHACPIERSIFSAQRINTFCKGLDLLRNDYFEAKILKPHIKMEKELNELP